MSKRSDDELLGDIFEAARRIKNYTFRMSYERFLRDAKTQDAVTRNLEVMGEGAKNVSAVLKKQHPEIPWKQLAGVRDRLIHHYFGVNYDIVWSIVTNELPRVALTIQKVLRKLK